MSAWPLATTWDVPLEELARCWEAAGINLPRPDGAPSSVSDVPLSTRAAWVRTLREIVHRAWDETPPVSEWWAASESLVLNDDGSDQARRQSDAFWQRLNQIVNGSHALLMLGDLSALPFFIELLRHQPGGHLTGLAQDVLCHYVDPLRELDVPHLIHKAEEFLIHEEHQDTQSTP